MNLEADTLSVGEAARLLGVHVNTVRTWTDQGRLACVRANARGDRRYRRDEIAAFLDAMRPNPAPPAAFRSRLVPRGSRSVAWALDVPGRVLAAPAGAPFRLPDDAAGRPVVPFPVRPSATQGGGDAGIIDAVTGLAGATAQAGDLDTALRAATRMLRDPARFRMIAIGAWEDGRLVARTADGIHRARSWWQTVDTELALRATRDGRQMAGVAEPETTAAGRRTTAGASVCHLVTPIGSGEGAWGVLIAELPDLASADDRTRELLTLTAGILELATRRARIADRGPGDAARWRSVAELGAELGARLDVPQLTERLATGAARPFGADHTLVTLAGRDGAHAVTTSDGTPARLAGALALAAAAGPLHAALAAGRSVAILAPATDPRAADLAAAAERSGIGSIALAPLGTDGALALCHDAPHAWTADELEMLESLAAQATVALRNARDLARMAGWAAQLASIRALGMRLTRFLSVAEIGQAICQELRELIAYDDVRVYRVAGDELLPVAWLGTRDPYASVDGERLRLRVGEGITGWVVRHGTPAILGDAAHDPRARTVPGTDASLDESMLLVPLRDDARVIGVIVLSRLGLDRFGEDDLRYLEIYAAMAAQAMVNADTTEQLREQSRHLERRLETQSELLRVTESILSSLDPRRVIDEITARLGALVPVDQLTVEMRDGDAADGVRVLEDGAGTWARIVAPLRRRDGGTGTLRLERRGRGVRFEPWEVELVSLFAGQVSIALANAVAHRAVEERAATDPLTGLRNHGAFRDELAGAIARGTPFGLLMIDLDDFKSWNDTHGHESGNRLLRAVAEALAAACRETDRVYRYGGDEFAIILPDTTGASAVEVAERLPRAVRAASDDRVACSIGIALHPADAADAEGMIGAADAACYVAKRAGGSRVAIAADGLATMPPGAVEDGAAGDPAGDDTAGPAGSSAAA
ncbi:MAG: diguanylate cyclase domain-containing protein [Chloroflexota bacterium]